MWVDPIASDATTGLTSLAQEQSRCERQPTRPLVVHRGRLTLDWRDARNHAKGEAQRSDAGEQRSWKRMIVMATLAR
jgi:hypothetical protein